MSLPLPGPLPGYPQRARSRPSGTCHDEPPSASCRCQGDPRKEKREGEEEEGEEEEEEEGEDVEIKSRRRSSQLITLVSVRTHDP